MKDRHEHGRYKIRVMRESEVRWELKRRAVTLGVPLMNLGERYQAGLTEGPCKHLRNLGRKDKIRDMDV